MLLSAPAAAQEKQPPYWASIASGQAMTRTGPGKNYPGIWLYQRRDLPVRVVKKYDNWRLIQDPDGAQGWMLVTLAQRPPHGDRQAGRAAAGPRRPVRQRQGRAIAPSRASSAASANAATAGAGSRSASSEGYVRTSDIWGVGDNEVVD